MDFEDGKVTIVGPATSAHEDLTNARTHHRIRRECLKKSWPSERFPDAFLCDSLVFSSRILFYFFCFCVP